MLKLCGTLYRDNRIVKDLIITIEDNLDLLKFLEDGLKIICDQFDIETPYLLNTNKSDFIKRGKTIFTEDNFMDSINFDSLLIENLSNI